MMNYFFMIKGYYLVFTRESTSIENQKGFAIGIFGLFVLAARIHGSKRLSRKPFGFVTILPEEPEHLLIFL